MTPFIQKIVPNRHALPHAMQCALLGVSVRPAPEQKGDWRVPLASRPNVDTTRPQASLMASTYEQLSHVVPPHGGRIKCTNYYPPGGGIGWHTDSAQPGWRVYIHSSDRPGTAFYYGEQTFIEEMAGGFIFTTGPGCWHALLSVGHRLACGFQVPEPLAREILAVAS